jgi:hypothetical protein
MIDSQLIFLESQVFMVMKICRYSPFASDIHLGKFFVKMPTNLPAFSLIVCDRLTIWTPLCIAMNDNASPLLRWRDSHKSHAIKTTDVPFRRETDWRHSTWLCYNEFQSLASTKLLVCTGSEQSLCGFAQELSVRYPWPQHAVASRPKRCWLLSVCLALSLFTCDWCLCR